MCTQRPEVGEPAVERAFWGEWKQGQRPQVFSEEQDLCKELDFILTELWSGKLQELPYDLKHPSAVVCGDQAEAGGNVNSREMF